MENARYRNDVFRIVGKRGGAGADTKCTDSNPQECFGAAISDNRQKVGNGRSVAVRLYLSCCSHWRSLGETADGFRNADKSERNRITCSLSDTTGVYHRQSSGFGRDETAAPN